jgi:hypothetical protein
MILVPLCNLVDITIYCVCKGAFTLGVRDLSVESPNTMLVITNLHLLTINILCYTNIHLTLSYCPFNIGCHLGCHLDFHLTYFKCECIHNYGNNKLMERDI